MKNATSKLMFAAAALVAVAGMASAQTMEAKIPFAFRAGERVFPAGTYQVDLRSQASGNKLIFLSNAAGGSRGLAVGYATGNVKKGWAAAGDPVLAFQCGIGRCALREVWSGNAGSPAYQIHVPSLGKDEPSHVAEVTMRVKSE